MKNRRSLSLTAVLLCISFFFLTIPPRAGGEEYGGGIRTEVLTKSGTASNGQALRYPCTERPEVTAMIVHIPPGQETGRHYHKIPVLAYVLDGTLTVEIEGGQTLMFRPGQVILEVQDTIHNGINRGTVPVKLVVFYVGEEGKPLVYRGEPSRP
ncbi:MAG TPA: cupin domain-containing protein [Syntrophales bacterium]|nr:cupin domain-containing protein [Syntrophales bacterium]HOM07759.1 cupin domain-containing protein [Syntrophales bacterium]HPC00793.1 cupin domain-containing protein [Syntrophales bacterium]HPQ06009.1 cupin domain-containing protein [Syntrophales bacterium]HRS86626.1 cupin domain-containing protein [Syntrophales bacterium]